MQEHVRGAVKMIKEFPPVNSFNLLKDKEVKLKSQPLKKVTSNTYISKPCPFCGGQIAKQTMICEQCGTGFPKNPENHSYELYLDNSVKADDPS